MTDTRKNARPASRWMGFLSAALAAAPGLAYAQPVDLFYERAVMAAAHERCGLFAPEVATALAAATAQARGAALRGGASRDDLRAVKARAHAMASRTDCASPDLEVAAGRVRGAFSGFARTSRPS